MPDTLRQMCFGIWLVMCNNTQNGCKTILHGLFVSHRHIILCVPLLIFFSCSFFPSFSRSRFIFSVCSFGFVGFFVWFGCDGITSSAFCVLQFVWCVVFFLRNKMRVLIRWCVFVCEHLFILNCIICCAKRKESLSPDECVHIPHSHVHFPSRIFNLYIWNRKIFLLFLFFLVNCSVDVAAICCWCYCFWIRARIFRSLSPLIYSVHLLWYLPVL